MNEPLARVADGYFRALVESSPFAATLLGVRDVDDRVPDPSEEGQAAVRRRFEDIRRAAELIDPESLDTGDKVTRAVLLAMTRDGIAEIDAALEELSASSFFTGPQAQVLSYVPKLELLTAQQADAYLTRLTRIPVFLAASAERLRDGVRKGRPATARGVRDSIAQIDRYLALPLDEDPLATPAAPQEWQGSAAWHDRRAQVLTDTVRPALRELRDRLAEDVLPAARDDDRCGLCWLPDGDALYAQQLRIHTTTERTPDQIHALGLQVVAQLADEYRALGAATLGTADLDGIFRRLREDPALDYADPNEAVAAAETAVARAAAAVPDWFARVPQKACDVKPIPEVESSGMTIAYYQPPADDGSTNGTYWINVAGPVPKRYEAECVAFHEALPGHHLQIALAQELEGLPRFRRFGVPFTAYSEGWGLYTERLADEMGLYSTDLDRIGMLACDSLRACRLVVDTGLHALGWSRQQAIDYMLANSPLGEEVVVAEVDRYIVLPGQAAGYMVGRIEIERLRREATDALGPRFDIKAFHDVVLGNGAVPLTVLGDIVADWVAASSTHG